MQRACGEIRWKRFQEKKEAAAADRLPPTLRSIRLAAAAAKREAEEEAARRIPPPPSSDASLLMDKSTVHVFVLWCIDDSDDMDAEGGEAKGDESAAATPTSPLATPLSPTLSQQLSPTSARRARVRWGNCVVLDVPIYADKPSSKTLKAAAHSDLRAGTESYSLCPLALNVQAPQSLTHDFQLGPCRVDVVVVVRNNARPKSQPMTFDLVLLDKPVGEAASTSKLSPVQWYVVVSVRSVARAGAYVSRPRMQAWVRLPPRHRSEARPRVSRQVRGAGGHVAAACGCKLSPCSLHLLVPPPSACMQLCCIGRAPWHVQPQQLRVPCGVASGRKRCGSHASSSSQQHH